MLTKILLLIIENPDAKNAYLKLKKYYEDNNQLSEAEALNYLIQKKFHDNNTDNNSQQ
jgi:hypothetical protein